MTGESKVTEKRQAKRRMEDVYAKQFTDVWESIQTLSNKVDSISEKVEYVKTNGCFYRPFHDEKIQEVKERMEKHEERMDKLDTEIRNLGRQVFQWAAFAGGFVAVLGLVAGIIIKEVIK